VTGVVDKVSVGHLIAAIVRSRAGCARRVSSEFVGRFAAVSVCLKALRSCCRCEASKGPVGFGFANRLRGPIRRTHPALLHCFARPIFCVSAPLGPWNRIASPVGFGKPGRWGRSRTCDTWIHSPLLYQLSYPDPAAVVFRTRNTEHARPDRVNHVVGAPPVGRQRTLLTNCIEGDVDGSRTQMMSLCRRPPGRRASTSKNRGRGSEVRCQKRRDLR